MKIVFSVGYVMRPIIRWELSCHVISCPEWRLPHSVTAGTCCSHENRGKGS